MIAPSRPLNSYTFCFWKNILTWNQNSNKKNVTKCIYFVLVREKNKAQVKKKLKLLSLT